VSTSSTYPDCSQTSPVSVTPRNTKSPVATQRTELACWRTNRCAPTRNNIVQKVPATEIPVFHPQIAGLDQLDALGKQTPFLGVSVSTEDGRGDEIPSGFEDHQGKAGQWSGVLFAQDFESPIGGGDFIAVDDSESIAGKEFRSREHFERFGGAIRFETWTTSV